MPAIFRPLTALCLLLAALCLPQAPARAQDEQVRKAEIESLIKQWADARVKGDTVFLERFYAPELRLYQMNGGVVERKDDIALFAARLIRPDYIRNTDLDIHVYGDTAFVSTIESLKGTYRGRAGEMALRMLNILVHRDERWQLVATQSTPIQQSPGG